MPKSPKRKAPKNIFLKQGNNQFLNEDIMTIYGDAGQVEKPSNDDQNGKMPFYMKRK